MPLSPISLLVGGTLAAVGSAYVFKKVEQPISRYCGESDATLMQLQFVYDPHLAPLVDALLAQYENRDRHLSEPYQQHRPSRRSQHDRQGIPVPVSVGTTSSRQQYRVCHPGPVLRRRSMRRDSNEFDREALRDRSEGAMEMVITHTGAERRRSVDTLPVYREDETEGAYAFGAVPKVEAVSQSTHIPVLEAGTAQTAHAALLHHPRPLRLSRDADADLLAAPTPVDVDDIFDYTQQASTAFSILSLSQISSPDSPTVALASMQRPHHTSRGSVPSPSAAPTGLAMSGMLVSLVDETTPADADDVLSLADTDLIGVRSLSSRTTSPPQTLPNSPSIRSENLSPLRSDAASPFAPAVSLDELQTLSELGLSWVSSRGATRLGSPLATASGLTRAPLSVVSLSDSEGWSAGSDWDGVGDEHRI